MSATSHLVVAASLLVATAASADRDDAKPEPPRPAQLDPAAVARLHMRGKFDELRAAERALIRGRLVEAKVSAHAIATAPDDPELAAWIRDTAQVRALAEAVATSASADDALRRLPAVAAACAECHVATGHWPGLAKAPRAPADTGIMVPRMARHAWAADRMWDGLVGGDEAAWRAGLEVLAATPPPYAIVDRDEVALGNQLQAFAKTALANRPNDSLAARTRAYGEMLVTCAACHETSSQLPRRKP